MIPKVIHYCWFGGGPKSELVKTCIESWKQFCPDYEIKEWNETNWDVSKNEYCKEAYEKQKWAFVSDIARLDIVYKYGGIYLDTDVELHKSLDDLLDYNGFLCFHFETRINTGLGFGAIKRSPVIHNLLSDYEGRHFILDNGKMDLTACTYYNTNVLESIFLMLELDDSFQVLDNFAFISTNLYNEIAIHHEAASWTDREKTIISVPRIPRDSFLKKFLRDPKKQKWIRKHTSRKVQFLYTWVAYDLLEYGIWYFIKHKIGKCLNHEQKR